MLKVLTFIDWFWPGFKAGGPVRSLLNLTEHLSGEITFYIVTRDTDYMSHEPYSEIQCNSWNEIRPGIHVYYISGEHLSRKTIHSFFRENNNYDLVYINGIYSWYFSILPLYFSRKAGLAHVVAPRGMLSQQTFSSKKRLKKIFFVAARVAGLYKRARFHATMEREASDIAGIVHVDPAMISVAPNLPRKSLPERIPLREKQPGSLQLISIARIAPEKNILFAIQVLKGLTGGQVILDLYGELYNSEYWGECLRLMESLPENIQVNSKGSINSDNIPETLLNYHFLLMPSRGENFGHSILESLMSGCPVVISDKTPWRDLEKVRAGWDIPLDKPGEFTSILQKCLEMGQEAYNDLSEGALVHAREFVDNPKLVEASKNMFYGKS